ncbi:uncharacterized protein LOC135100421 isoform X2 [Scylla paramamosain]|uniref:uncharacterized protein LOC135100421 isoform X2 n=1 Tax=Scylla paramamosain TaxID=85552 RepID=UPI003082B27A
MTGVVWMCEYVNLSYLRLSVRRLEQEIAEPCCREERMAGGAAVNTPNTCRRKQRRDLFPSSRPDDEDWLFPAPPDTLTIYWRLQWLQALEMACVKHKQSVCLDYFDQAHQLHKASVEEYSFNFCK